MDETSKLYTGGGSRTLVVVEYPAPREPGAGIRSWLDRRHLIIVYAVFLAYAAIDATFSAGRDQVWAIWAACGYAAALVMLWRWGIRTAAVLVSVALAVVAPLIWLSVAYPLEDGMVVIERSASLLLHHGSPYLTASQVTSWLSYNPYLPVMTLFGLPAALGLGGLAGNPGVWLALGTVAVLAAAFWIAMPPQEPHQPRESGELQEPREPGEPGEPREAELRPGRHWPRLDWRCDALLATAVAVASPVIGLNLAVITTDPPVVALTLLSLALSAPRAAKGAAARAVSSGAVLAVACDLKSTAWLAVPVMAAMFASRDGARAAYRFLAGLVLTAAALIALLAPAVLIRRDAAVALVQNSVLFPLGLTHDKTPAESLLPGHMLSALGTAGHAASVGLLFAAGLAVAVSLVIRPPRDVPAAIWRLVIGLALMFLLGPDVRFGYFIYPLGLLGWLALNQVTRPEPSGTASPGKAQQPRWAPLPRRAPQPRPAPARVKG
jgi:hypothetical protein